MVDFEVHKVIEDLLPAKGVGASTIVFYLWFVSRFPNGARWTDIASYYGVKRRQAFRYIKKLVDLDMVERVKRHGQAFYRPIF